MYTSIYYIQKAQYGFNCDCHIIFLFAHRKQREIPNRLYDQSTLYFSALFDLLGKTTQKQSLIVLILVLSQISSPLSLCCCAVLSRSVMSNSLGPHGPQTARLLCPWRFSREEYWSGSLSFLQGNFPTQELQVSCIASRFFTSWATSEAPIEFIYDPKYSKCFMYSNLLFMPTLWVTFHILHIIFKILTFKIFPLLWKMKNFMIIKKTWLELQAWILIS